MLGLGFAAPKFSKIEEFQKKWSATPPTFKQQAYLWKAIESGLIPKGFIEDSYVLSVNPKNTNELIFENSDYRFTLPYASNIWFINDGNSDRPAKPNVSNYLFHWVYNLLEKLNIFSKPEATRILGGNRDN